MIFSVTRRFCVSCAHRLYNCRLSKEDNDAVYGQCVNTHGHNYTIQLTWTGPLDTNGMVVNLSLVKQVVDVEVIQLLDHKLIDELPFFKDCPSTTENLCLFVFYQLRGFDYGQAKLTGIKIMETENNIFELQIA